MNENMKVKYIQIWLNKTIWLNNKIIAYLTELIPWIEPIVFTQVPHQF